MLVITMTKSGISQIPKYEGLDIRRIESYLIFLGLSIHLKHRILPIKLTYETICHLAVLQGFENYRSVHVHAFSSFIMKPIQAESKQNASSSQPQSKTLAYSLKSFWP